ncbi:MAG: hypothetical protein F6K42_13450 [Leptolyngbya sp. SIO1D8]|nr:hypothetical protein [Leptolyngbya sp. SIO1D8]
MFSAPIVLIAIVILLLWTRECASSPQNSSSPESEPDDVIKALAQYLKED